MNAPELNDIIYRNGEMLANLKPEFWDVREELQLEADEAQLQLAWYQDTLAKVYALAGKTHTVTREIGIIGALPDRVEHTVGSLDLFAEIESTVPDLRDRLSTFLRALVRHKLLTPAQAATIDLTPPELPTLAAKRRKERQERQEAEALFHSIMLLVKQHCQHTGTAWGVGQREALSLYTTGQHVRTTESLGEWLTTLAKKDWVPAEYRLPRGVADFINRLRGGEGTK